MPTNDDLRTALAWVLAEVDYAAQNAAYKKDTLVTNIRDRVGAALRTGRYARALDVDTAGPEVVATSERWRVGTKLGRTLYVNDAVVGIVDTAALAKQIVDACNREPTSGRPDADAIEEEEALAAAVAEREAIAAYIERIASSALATKAPDGGAASLVEHIAASVRACRHLDAATPSAR